MSSYTDEQLNYINYDNKDNHTKLLACAGSGKTRCIIARINKLIEKKVYNPDEILMLTFSRFTRDDFMNKIKSYGGTHIDTNSIKTIDKFAKQIIDPALDGIDAAGVAVGSIERGLITRTARTVRVVAISRHDSVGKSIRQP